MLYYVSEVEINKEVNEACVKCRKEIGKMTLMEGIKPNTIGEKTAVLRHMLGYTQVEFAKSVLMARPNLAKLEKTKSNDEIRTDTLLRVFYAVSRLAESNSTGYVKDMAVEIRNDIIQAIER